MTTPEAPLERSVLISATRPTVFRYFTDSKRWADWWGAGSRIEAAPGGAVHIQYPFGITASGQVVEVVPDERVVFTYGYDEPGKPIPPGGSRVTITLQDRPEGTLVTLRHDLDVDAAARNEHTQGWRYQLALFANVVAREQHAAASERIDRFFAVWSEPDAMRRRSELAAVATDDLSFQDSFSCTGGIDDLVGHVAGFQTHMPVHLVREGEVRQCQGTAIVDWVAQMADGQVRGRGSNVFDLAPDGRIARVVGFWKS